MDKQRKEYVSVKLEKTLVARLHELKRPSQTITGVIQELVDSGTRHLPPSHVRFLENRKQ